MEGEGPKQPSRMVGSPGVGQRVFEREGKKEARAGRGLFQVSYLGVEGRGGRAEGK